MQLLQVWSLSGHGLEDMATAQHLSVGAHAQASARSCFWYDVRPMVMVCSVSTTDNLGGFSFSSLPMSTSWGSSLVFSHYSSNRLLCLVFHCWAREFGLSLEAHVAAWETVVAADYSASSSAIGVDS